MYARWRSSQPRGRTVLKTANPADTVRYPDVILFPDVGVFPQDTTGPATYITVDGPTVDQVNSAIEAYLGGHVYTVSDTEAAQLTAAGYTVFPHPVDRVAPHIQILAPAPGATVAGIFRLILSHEPSVTVEVKVYRGNDMVVNSVWATGAFTTFTVQVDTALFPNGTYRIQATATDSSGNTASTHTDVQVLNVTVPDVGVPVLPSLTTLPSPSLVP